MDEKAAEGARVARPLSLAALLPLAALRRAAGPASSAAAAAPASSRQHILCFPSLRSATRCAPPLPTGANLQVADSVVGSDSCPPGQAGATG